MSLYDDIAKKKAGAVMQVDQLLSILETLPYHERVRHMVELGKQSRTDATPRQLLITLSQGEMYQRMLALQACYGSCDGETILHALSDPSRTIRQMAIRMVAIICDDAQVQTAFVHLPEQTHLDLLRMLKKQRRQTAIDTYLQKRITGEADTWIHLIGFGSDTLVSPLIETALMQGDYIDARRLASRHPALMAETLRQLAERVTQMDQRLLWIANVTLPILTDLVPDQALEAVKALSRHLVIARRHLEQLVLRRPVELSAFVLTLPEQAQVDFSRSIEIFPIERITALIEAGYLSGHTFAHWGEKLEPAVRAELFHRFGIGWRDANGVIPFEALELLPRERRESEARRHLSIPSLVTEPKQRLPYAALLPWTEALDELTPYLRNADAELRAAAWTPLIGAVKFHRDRLPDVLAMLIARRNEQDPVRSAFLNALADLPPGMWRAEHLAELGQVFRDALNASDLSYGSAHAVETMVIQLLRHHPEWSASWLATLVKERGQIHQYRLESVLSPDDVRRIAHAVMPILQSWAVREREHQLYGFASALGKRIIHFPGLLDLLDTVIRTTANAWLASNLLSLIKRHDLARFHRLTLDLLRKDASWITVHDVHQHLHQRAQHLLTPYLGQTAFKGRFATGKTRYILPIDRGFYRWTPKQQTIFAEVLNQVTADNERDVPALLFVIHQLAGLMIAPTRLIELASSEKITVRDTAVRALGRLDAGEGVPVLLEAMGDDRGRIAIYALRKSLLEMTPDRALVLLRGVPTDRVTIAKEVVRLIGDLRTPESYTELLTFAGRELHNDVRVALVRALWNYLDDERTWATFASLLITADPSVMAIIARTPANTLSHHAQARLIDILGQLMTHADPAVRLNVLRRLRDLPVTDPAQRLLEPLFIAVQSDLPQEVESGSNAIFATYASRQADLIRETLILLLPARRALLIFLNALTAAVRARPLYLTETTLTAVDVLERDPLLTAYQIRAALNGLAWDQAAALLVRLSESGRLHAGVLAEALTQVGGSIWKPDHVERFEDFMRQQSDPMLRRIGLAALQSLTGSERRGWTESARAQLELYRADPDPLVASAAQFIFPPE